jgi:hypothetical protein
MMEFQMEMTAVKIQNSVPVLFTDMATWNASVTQSQDMLEVNDAATMVKHSAVTVYRIVTVVVSTFKQLLGTLIYNSMPGYFITQL